jgi:hypothetical protein
MLEDDIAWMIQDIQSGAEINRQRLIDLLQRMQQFQQASFAELHCIEQTAGQAMNYPWYKDDQKNFPGATEIDGVCTGEHVAATIVAELADNYRYLQSQLRLALDPEKVEIKDPLKKLLAYAATLPGSDKYNGRNGNGYQPVGCSRGITIPPGAE